MVVGVRTLVLTATLTVTLTYIYTEIISTPSCHLVYPLNNGDPLPSSAPSSMAADDSPNDFTAIVVSNFLLLGSHSSLFHSFSDFFLSKFLSKSYETLKPDVLLVLGDISAEGYQLTKNKWSYVLHQFQRILGPYLGIPSHVTLGDRDIGRCDKLGASTLHRVSTAFPELDSSGCGSFEFKNVSFVSLNTLGLLCGSNEVVYDIERLIESESAHMRMRTVEKHEPIVESKVPEISYEYRWRENYAASQSGPVLLLHFPMHQMSERYCKQGSGKTTVFNSLMSRFKLLNSWKSTVTDPYDMLQSLPPNVTEYIFQALKPRIIFSGHNRKFCDVTHPDGTREVNVPALRWTVNGDPGFVVATFRKNQVIVIRHCSLPKESHIVIACLVIFAFSILAAIVPNLWHSTSMKPS